MGTGQTALRPYVVGLKKTGTNENGAPRGAPFLITITLRGLPAIVVPALATATATVAAATTTESTFSFRAGFVNV